MPPRRKQKTPVKRVFQHLPAKTFWIDNDASRRVTQDAGKLGEVADEMADVACYLLALSNTLGIDLSEAIVAKLAKNARKYPAELSRGRYQKPEQGS